MQLPMGLAGTACRSSARSDADQMLPILVLGVAGLFAQYCVANAFRAGDASLVIPLDFLRIPLIAVVGWLFYAEALDAFVFAGAGVIIVGVLWNLRSEARAMPVVPVVRVLRAAGNTGSDAARAG